MYNICEELAIDYVEHNPDNKYKFGILEIYLLCKMAQEAGVMLGNLNAVRCRQANFPDMLFMMIYSRSKENA